MDQPFYRMLVSLVAFTIALGGYLALVLTGHDGDALIGKAITLFAILGLGSYNASQFRRTHDKLDQVTHQTNGALDARIEEAIRRVQTEAADPAGALSASVSDQEGADHAPGT